MEGLDSNTQPVDACLQFLLAPRRRFPDVAEGAPQIRFNILVGRQQVDLLPVAGFAELQPAAEGGGLGCRVDGETPQEVEAGVGVVDLVAGLAGHL